MPSLFTLPLELKAVIARLALGQDLAYAEAIKLLSQAGSGRGNGGKVSLVSGREGAKATRGK